MRHSERIKKMGYAVILLSLALGGALGLVFGTSTKTVSTSVFNQSVTNFDYQYNFPICILTIVVGVLFSFVLFAIAHNTAAIEELGYSVNLTLNQQKNQQNQQNRQNQ